MWKFLQSNANGVPIDIHTGLDDHPTLITEGLRTLGANWKSSGITTATTTVVVEARENQSLLLTDIIIILSKKVAGASILLEFAGGSNKVGLFTLDAGIEPFRFSHSFTGGIRGWRDADLEVVTSGTTNLSVLVGYVHISTEASKDYYAWLADR